MAVSSAWPPRIAPRHESVARDISKIDDRLRSLESIVIDISTNVDSLIGKLRVGITVGCCRDDPGTSIDDKHHPSDLENRMDEINRVYQDEVTDLNTRLSRMELLLFRSAFQTSLFWTPRSRNLLLPQVCDRMERTHPRNWIS